MVTDPRDVKGSVAGPGGPHDRNAVVLDTGRAVLLDAVDVCRVETGRSEVALAMVLAGRINRSQDRAEVLFLFDADGVAAIVTELLALAARIDDTELKALIDHRLQRLADADALGGERRG